MDSEIKEIIDVTEVWEEVLILLAVTHDGKFAVWADRKEDQVTVVPRRDFSSEDDARVTFKYLVDLLLELVDPIAAPRMLAPNEVKELGDPDILLAIDQNPMDDDGRIYVLGRENDRPFLAHFKRGFRDAQKSYFSSNEAALREFRELWSHMVRLYGERQD